jgi:SAM-dependent methyltransferase
VNALERLRWNDDDWAASWPRREQLTSMATESLFEHLSLAPRERVLDVGSGAGAASLRAAGLVGPEGRVVGADISEPLVRFATEAATAASVGNATFLVADVQQDAVDGAPYDVVMSQFGVMFFEDPVAAFANIRAHVVAGGRLAFACWQSPSKNPWFVGHALRALLTPPAPPAPGKHVTGPFAFSDGAETEAILGAAGWADVCTVLIERTVTLDRDVIADASQVRMMGLAPELLDEASAATDAYFAPLTGDDGRLVVQVAYRIVTAATPA